MHSPFLSEKGLKIMKYIKHHLLLNGIHSYTEMARIVKVYFLLSSKDSVTSQILGWRDICTAKSTPYRFPSLTCRYDLISFTFRAGALEIQNHADSGLKDDSHQVTPILD